MIYNLFDVRKIINLEKIFSELTSKTVKNDFWIDVLKSYIEYINKIKTNSWDKILNMPLFYNEHFKINSKVIYIKELYDRGFRMVRDLMYNNGNFISLEKY